MNCIIKLSSHAPILASQSNLLGVHILCLQTRPLSPRHNETLSQNLSPQWPILRSFINSPANINNNVVLVIGHGTTTESNVSFKVQFSFFHDTFFMESSSAHSRVFRHIFTSIPSRHISFRHGNVPRESLVV